MLIIIHSETNQHTISRTSGVRSTAITSCSRNIGRYWSAWAGDRSQSTRNELKSMRCTWTARARGEPCVFLSFSPPHRTPVHLACPTLPVFAWEFSTIPNEPFAGEPRNDWRTVLARLRQRRSPIPVTPSTLCVRR
jgi:hypothetical protein